MSIYKTILLTASLGCTIPVVRAEDNVLADTVRFGLVTGALAGCCYGLYKLGSWLLSKTDQQILDDGYHIYDTADFHYQSMLTILESRHDALNVRSINESLLYDLGVAKITFSYIDEYIMQLKRDINNLISHHYTLLKRSSSLQQEAVYDGALYHIKREMDALAVRINQLVLRLEFLHEFLYYHKAYFVLFECESDMYGKYDRELKAIQDYSLDYYQKKHIIQSAAFNHFSHYPYFYYAQMVERDYQRLDIAMYYVSEEYIYRKKVARQLKGHLFDIREMIIGDDRYHQEIMMRDQEERERQLLEMQERQVKALERQAQAAEQKARALNELKKMKKKSIYIVPDTPSIKIRL